jgi:hypothetical protein
MCLALFAAHYFKITKVILTKYLILNLKC